MLAALCAIAKRLDGDHACEQGEKRLHRALQALMAQDPARCGAFLFRAASLFDVAVSDAFAARCPDEACVWGLRLAVCRFQLKTEDLRTSDCLRRALSGLGGQSPKVTTVRLARLAEALGQVATTPDAARRSWTPSMIRRARASGSWRCGRRGVAEDEVAPRRLWSRPTTSRRGAKIEEAAAARGGADAGRVFGGLRLGVLVPAARRRGVDLASVTATRLDPATSTASLAGRNPAVGHGSSGRRHDHRGRAPGWRTS